MMKKKKRKSFIICITILIMTMLFTTILSCADQQQITVKYSGTKVRLNGQPLSLKDASSKTVEPFNYNGTIYLPISAISKALGLTVSYDSTSKTVILTGTVSSSGSTAAGASAGVLPKSTSGSAIETPPTGKPDVASGSAIGMPPNGTSGSAMSIPSDKTKITVTQKKITVSYDNIKVTLNGKLLSLKDSNGNTVKPFNYNGTIYLPLRAVSQALGLTVSYDTTRNDVSLSNGTQGGNFK